MFMTLDHGTCHWHSLERDEFGKYYVKEVHK